MDGLPKLDEKKTNYFFMMVYISCKIDNIALDREKNEVSDKHVFFDYYESLIKPQSPPTWHSSKLENNT